jgi:hypothetical protein
LKAHGHTLSRGFPAVKKLIERSGQQEISLSTLKMLSCFSRL